jgi:uncharacterized glyoxalase superfamily protein PhnB
MSSTETNPATQPDDRPAAGSVPAPTVWPTLAARDAHALIDFLVDTLGFTRVAVFANGDRVEHAELAWPEGGGVMIGGEKPGWARKAGASGLYVVTQHVEELYERVRAAGATISRELQHEDYGNHGFTVTDPEGNDWSFGTYRGEPVPD